MAEPNHDRPLPEPDLRLQRGAALVELYDLEAMVGGPDGVTSTVYENQDLGQALRNVTLEVTPRRAGDNYTLAMDLKVQFDETDNTRYWMERLFARMCGYDQGYALRATELADMIGIDTDGGLGLRAWFRYEAHELWVTNDLTRAGLADPGGSLRVAPQPFNEVHGDRQLAEMSLLMAGIVDSACQVTGADAPDGYVIGMMDQSGRPGGRPNERPAAPSSDRTRWLGAAAVGAAPGSRPARPEQRPAAPVAERILLSDVGGNEALKDMLREIVLSFQNPAIVAKWGAARPQGVLLYGPPGTGKTMIATAMANELDAELVPVQSSDIYGKYLGESEESIKRLFALLKDIRHRTVVLFDEFDSILSVEDGPASGASSARNGVAGLFKQEMNNLAEVNPDVLVIATTNHPDQIDPALRRRFNYQVPVPVPDETARLNIFSITLARRLYAEASDFVRFDFSNLDLPELARQTDGFSGADITEVFRRLQMTKAMHEMQTGQADPITQADFRRAIVSFRREKPAG